MFISALGSEASSFRLGQTVGHAWGRQRRRCHGDWRGRRGRLQTRRLRTTRPRFRLSRRTADFSSRLEAICARPSVRTANCVKKKNPQLKITFREFNWLNCSVVKTKSKKKKMFKNMLSELPFIWMLHEFDSQIFLSRELRLTDLKDWCYMLCNCL